MKTGGRYREVLGVADARALIAASAASQVGDWLYNAALLGYVYTATGSSGWVAVATIVRLLPYALLGPLGGTIADRHDRRSVLIVGDLLRLVLMLALAAVVASDGDVVFVIALTALASTAGSAERPAALALLPRLVGETRLGPANALLHTVQNLAIVVGPAIGAILLTVASPATSFAVNGATFAVSALLISTIRRRGAPTQNRQVASFSSELREGFRATRTTVFVAPLLVVVAMIEMTYGAQTVLLVLYADRVLDLGDGGYGYLLAAAGAGGLLSALINGRLAANARVAIIVCLTSAVACVTQMLYAGVDDVVVVLLITLFGGVAIVACEVVAETALARIVPSGLLGRVMGVFDALSVAAMVIGAFITPLLVHLTSLSTAFVITGGAALVLTVACFSPLRGLDALTRERQLVLASRMAIVEKLSIAAGAPPMVLEQLASAAQVISLPPGVDVVVQGAPAHAFFAIIDGSAVVHRDEQQVVRLGPGEHFGERGLLDNAPRNATVTTAEDSTLLRLEGNVLLDALQSAPTLMAALEWSNAPRHTSPEATRLVDDPNWVPS